MRGYRPESMAELRQVMAEAGPGAALVAGGTDWVIAERRSGREPASLVYLGGIPELKKVELRENGMFVGACCTMHQLEQEPLLQGPWAVLAEAAAGVGSTQIRSRGTIGGNIAHASPAADSAPALMCLDAVALVLRQGETVEIPVERLIQGTEKTLLKETDVILGFLMPNQPEDTVSHYYKLGFRRQVSISRFGVAMALGLKEGRVTRAQIALGAIGPKAIRMPAMEQALLGCAPDEAAAERLGDILADYIRNTSGRRYKAWASRGVMSDALVLFQKGE